MYETVAWRDLESCSKRVLDRFRFNTNKFKHAGRLGRANYVDSVMTRLDNYTSISTKTPLSLSPITIFRPCPISPSIFFVFPSHIEHITTSFFQIWNTANFTLTFNRHTKISRLVMPLGTLKRNFPPTIKTFSNGGTTSELWNYLVLSIDSDPCLFALIPFQLPIHLNNWFFSCFHLKKSHLQLFRILILFYFIECEISWNFIKICICRPKTINFTPFPFQFFLPLFENGNVLFPVFRFHPFHMVWKIMDFLGSWGVLAVFEIIYFSKWLAEMTTVGN